MTLRSLSSLCALGVLWAAKPAEAAPPIQFDGPLTVMSQASTRVRLVSQSRCLSGRQFIRFTNGPARRVIYRHAYGTSEAVITCRNNRRMWIKIYPRNNKSVRFMSHGATTLVVQIRGPSGWTKVCEGRSCRRYAPNVSQASVQRWLTLNYKALRRLGTRFRNSHFVPRRFQRRLIGKPVFRRGRAPLPVVLFQAHKRYQVIRPDGSRPRRLSINAAYRLGSTSRGGAKDKPLLSPNGKWLADLVPRGLRITKLRSSTSRVFSFRGQRVLIGPWAPDSSGLLIGVGRGMMLLDPRTGKTTMATIRTTWGFNGLTTLSARPGNSGTTIVATNRATGRSHTLGSVPRSRVWMMGARGGTVAMRSRSGRTLELHVVLANGTWKLVAAANLVSGAFKLSPNGGKLAAILRDPNDRTRKYLTIIDVNTNRRRRLTRCSSLCNYYWYTNKTLVIETHREVSLLHLDGREHLLHRNAHLVRMRTHR